MRTLLDQMVAWWLLLRCLSVSAYIMYSSESDGDFASIGTLRSADSNAAAREVDDERVSAVAAGPKPEPRVPGDTNKRSKIEHEWVCGKMREKLAKTRAAKTESFATDACLDSIAKSSRANRMLVSSVRAKAAENPTKFRPKVLIGTLAKRLYLQNKRKCAMTDMDLLACAFHKSLRLRDIGRCMQLSASCVQFTKLSLAGNLYDMIRLYLEQCDSWTKRERPLAVFHGRKYDSATFFLRNQTEIPGLGIASGGQSARPVHSLQQKRFVIVVFPSSISELHFPSPSVPINDTSAGSMESSLDHSPQSSPLQAPVMNCMKNASTIGCTCDAADGAFPNVKYENKKMHYDGDGDGVEHCSSYCGNHATHVTDVILEHIADGRLAIRRLTNFSTLCRSNGFFLRIISGLVPAILTGLHAVEGLPPPGSQEKANMIMKHCLSHHKCFRTGKHLKKKKRTTTNKNKQN